MNTSVNPNFSDLSGAFILEKIYNLIKDENSFGKNLIYISEHSSHDESISKDITIQLNQHYSNDCDPTGELNQKCRDEHWDYIIQHVNHNLNTNYHIGTERIIVYTEDELLTLSYNDSTVHIHYEYSGQW